VLTAQQTWIKPETFWIQLFHLYMFEHSSILLWNILFTWSHPEQASAIIWTLKPESHWWDKREQTVIDEHTNHLCHTINCWYASTNCTLPWQKTNRWVGNCCTLKIHIMYSRDSSLWTQQHPDNKSLCLVCKFFDKTDQWQYLRSLVPSVWLWLIEMMAEGLLWMWPCK